MAVMVTIAALVGVDASPGASAARPIARPAQATATDSGELLFVNEGNRLRRIDVDTIGQASLVEDVLVERASSDPEGRDVNGQICERPDVPNGFIVGEDTGQPHPRPGWGVFDPDGTQVGKLAATYNVAGAEPHGCAINADGMLFTSDVGFQGFGTANGQLIQWFPPYTGFPGPPGAYPDTDAISTNFCKLAVDLGTAGSVAIDAQGRVYVSEASGTRINRFSPPFPTAPNAAGGCGATDATGAPLADAVQREVFATASDGMLTFSGLAFAPNGNLYAGSVLTGRIAEYDLDGNLVRLLLAPEQEVPPIPTGNPQALAVGADGTVYYADLNLEGTLPDVGPGPNGKVWRIRFDSAGNPLPPEIVREGLAFPDGVALFPGDLQSQIPPSLEWPTLAGGPERTFFNPNERLLTPETAPNLIERWRFPTDAVVTSSPAVATVELPGPRPHPRGVLLVLGRTRLRARLGDRRRALAVRVRRPARRVVPGRRIPHGRRRRWPPDRAHRRRGEVVRARCRNRQRRSGSSRRARAVGTQPASSRVTARSTANATKSKRHRSSSTASPTSVWTSTTSRPARAASTPSTPRPAR